MIPGVISGRNGIPRASVLTGVSRIRSATSFLVPGLSRAWPVVGDAAQMTEADRFEAFVREYQDMVFGTAVRLLGSSTEAEDVAQTVFLRAFERFDDMAASPTVPGWLKTVTTNLCLNHLTRYRARWQFFSELDRDDGAGGVSRFEATQPDAVSPDAALEEADRHAQLEQALRRLPDHQRVTLVLFHFEEKSYQDIAAMLGVSLAKVKTDIFRGREALRRELSGAHASR
jgi:RNA polymerase sigma-70 factor (ECF subfamily)